LTHFIVRAFRNRFPPTPAPRVLSGDWTVDERKFVVGEIYYGINHQTQGRAHRLPDDQKYDLRKNIELIECGSADRINHSWPFIRVRYAVNAVLQQDAHLVPVRPKGSFWESFRANFQGPFSGPWM